MGNNKLNILSFVIPLVLLSLIAFTSVEDSLLGTFKNKVNLVGYKTLKYAEDYNKTSERMRGDFIIDKDAYEKFILDNYGDNPDVKTYVMNYFYLYNERNIAFLENNKIAKGSDYDEKAMLDVMIDLDKRATIQFKCGQRIFKDKGINPVDFYKSMRDENKLIAKYAWSYLYDQDYTHGFDENTTCIAEKLY